MPPKITIGNVIKTAKTQQKHEKYEKTYLKQLKGNEQHFQSEAATFFLVYLQYINC